MSNTERDGEQMAKEYRFWLYDEMMRYMALTMDIIEKIPSERERKRALERARIEHSPIIERMRAY